MADAGVADGRSWVRVGSAVELFPDATDVDRSVEFCWPDDTPNRRMVRNVTRPTLTPYLPAPERATGRVSWCAPGAGTTSWPCGTRVRTSPRPWRSGVSRPSCCGTASSRPPPTTRRSRRDLAALAADPGRMDEITGRRAPLAVADGSAALDLVRAEAGSGRSTRTGSASSGSPRAGSSRPAPRSRPSRARGPRSSGRSTARRGEVPCRRPVRRRCSPRGPATTSSARR